MKKYDYGWLWKMSAYALLWVILIWLSISGVCIGFGSVEKWNAWVVLWKLVLRR